MLERLGAIESKPLKSITIDEPIIDKDEILVRIKACGVCRSNLHMIEGDWISRNVPSTLPLIPGHEIVGITESTGKDVDDFKVGDRVGIQPLYYACGVCEYCLTGRENICLNRKITGQDVDGGYAEYLKIQSKFAYKVPNRINDSEAAPLFCPGITAYRAVKKSNTAPGKILAIFGIGGVGHVAVQLARLWDAKVIAVSRNEKHLELASNLGAEDIVYPKEAEKYFKKIGYADSSIVFAPSNKAINQALSITKRGGTIVLGVSGKILNFQFFQEKTVQGTVIGTRQDMIDVLEIAANGKMKIFTENYKLEEANEVLKKLKYGEIEGRAVLLP